METASDRAPVAESEAAGDHPQLRAAVAVAAIAVAALYVILPSGLIALRELILYPGVELGMGLAVFAGVILYRPAAPIAWQLIGAGIVAFGLGDVIWALYALQGEIPFPTAADFFYLAGYPLFAAALIIAVRRRSGQFQSALLLDTAAIAIVFGLLIWVYVVQPTLRDSSLELGERLVTLAYPIGDFLLLVVVIRFLLGGSVGTPALRLLAIGFGLQLFADVAYARGLDAGGRLLGGFWLAAVICMGIAALHPSMRSLTRYDVETHWRVTRLTLVLFGLMAFIPFLVVVVQYARGNDVPDIAVAVTGSVLLAVILWRIAGMLSESERQTARRELLADFSAALLDQSLQADLVALANRTAAALVAPARGGAVETPNGITTHVIDRPVVVEGNTAAAVFADVRRRDKADFEPLVEAVAAQLAVALERQRLLLRERESAASLIEQNQRLKELDEMKTRFVSAASHELRTPLASIVGYVELLRDGEVGALNDEQQEFVNIISRNCDRLNSLVDDILFLGRADSDRLTLAPSDVDITSLVATELESLRAAAERRGVALVLEPGEDRPTLTADPTRLGQLVANLISNALKFTPAGGSVTVGVVLAGGDVVISVRDTGVGIPADELPRVFERFYRASTATAIAAPGTGIGLAIVRSIAAAHGGTVRVESEVGVGTTFTVVLPQEPPPDALIRKAAESSAAA